MVEDWGGGGKEVQRACSSRWGGSVPCEGPSASAWGEEEEVVSL